MAAREVSGRKWFEEELKGKGIYRGSEKRIKSEMTDIKIGEQKRKCRLI